MPTNITIIVTGKNITVQPTRSFFGHGSGTAEKIIWKGAGADVTIEEVRFPPKKNQGVTVPVSHLKKGSKHGEWEATWDATKKGVFHYSILVAKNGKELHPAVDPEVENDPKPPPPDDDENEREW